MTRSVLYCGIALVKDNFDQIKQQLADHKKLPPLSLGLWPSGKTDDTDNYYAFIELSDHDESSITIKAYVKHNQTIGMHIHSSLQRTTIMNNDQARYVYTVLNEQINT